MKGGTLCLIARDGLSCQCAGSSIPFILRPWREEQWNRKDVELYSKVVVEALEGITQSKTRISALDYIDEKVEDASCIGG
jgi:hypothetical protein